MEIFEFENTIVIKGICDFSVEQTLNCGQCFRFDKTENGEYVGVFKDKVLRLAQKGDEIILFNVNKHEFEEIWADYFDLWLDYDLIKEEFKKDEVLKKAITFCSGIRILNQYPWEALCSFIISQNNNIPRIKGIIKRFCESFGEPITGTYGYNLNFFSFPTPERIAGLSKEDLAPLRCGFRDSYILDAAKKVASGEIDLENVRKMPIEDARKALMTIKGVGPKVAECALLYGLHRLDAFPVDVWIKRALEALYPDGMPFFVSKYAGIAQQYIFHYVRTCEDALKKTEKN